MRVEVLIAIFAISVFSFSFFSFKLFAIFQQCSYKIKEFFNSLVSGDKKEIKSLSTYSLIFCVILSFFALFLNTNSERFVTVYTAFSIFFSGLYYLKSKVIKQSVFTKRFIRIYLASSIICGLYAVGAAYLFASINIRFCFGVALGLTPILSPVFISGGMLINLPYDRLRYQISKMICKKRLGKNKELIKIGITGSFAKTSVKEFLYKMLSVKYRVLATPMSYNTPLGICKTVKNDITNYDILIAEMGARYKNDIKELCKMVEPSVAVITGIAKQHTQTLGSVENVKRAKNQLIEGLRGDCFAVFSSQTPLSVEMYDEAKCQKFLVGEGENCFVTVKNIFQSKEGISFDMKIGDKSYGTFAPLLGEHNAYNIGLAVAVCLRLGVELEKVLEVIPTLRPIKHRAEMITTENGVLVIDDGYNANLNGISSTAKSVGVLDGYKVAVTAGIVELGEETENVNVEVGKILARYFDFVICVGSNSPYIAKGVRQVGVNTVTVDSMEEAKELIGRKIKTGDVVAFFNDIPDRY